MNKLDKQYIKLLVDIKENGVDKETRNGTVRSVFGRQIRHDMSEGFPLLTTKKMAIKSIMEELKWFLSGSTDIRDLRPRGCHIWDGDCYEKYKRAEEWDLEEPMSREKFFDMIDNDKSFGDMWGNFGPIYGHQWRKWGGYEIDIDGSGKKVSQYDQIKDVLHKLKNQPDSRRIMVNAWNVEDLNYMTLPPCHYGFQLYTQPMNDTQRWFEAVKRGLVNEPHSKMGQELESINFPKRKISLMWNQRSVDTPLGLPFNIASYAMLLELFAKETNMIPDELIGNLGDTHIYLNQMAGVEEQIHRKIVHELPTVEIHSSYILNGEFDYTIHNYQSQNAIKFPLSN